VGVVVPEDHKLKALFFYILRQITAMARSTGRRDHRQTFQAREKACATGIASSQAREFKLTLLEPPSLPPWLVPVIVAGRRWSVLGVDLA
jgi:hypothetical protein